MPARAQNVNVYYSNIAWTSSYVAGQTVLIPVANAQITVCNYPATVVPCTNLATLYVGPTILGGTSPTNPVSTDQYGNFGFWAAAGYYQYTVTNSLGQSAGPYTIVLGGSSGSATTSIPVTSLVLKGANILNESVAAIPGADYVQPSGSITGTASNLSGTPLLPNGTTAATQTPGDNTARLATDAFVVANGGVPSVFGRTGAVTAESGDYTVAQITGAAPLASPVLTGAPVAPTQTTGDNSTKIATDAFVLANAGSLPTASGGTLQAPATTAAGNTYTAQAIMPQGGVWQREGTQIAPTTLDQNNATESKILYEGNPQLLSGTTGNIFKLWWTCGYTTTGLCYAESIDAETWTRASSPVITPVLNTGVAHGDVVHVGSTYYYFTCQGAVSCSGINAYTSSNGVTWTLSQSNIITTSSGTTWSGVSNLGNVNLYNTGSGTWNYMIEAQSGSAFSMGVGTCTGNPPSMTCTAFSGNPVIQLDSNANEAGGPDVHEINNIWYVWFHCNTTGSGLVPDDICRAHAATFAAGDWTIDNGGNPVMTRATADEGQGTAIGQIADPAIIQVGNSLYMSYTAVYAQNGTSTDAFHLKLATAPLTFAQLVQTNEGNATAFHGIVSGEGLHIDATCNYYDANFNRIPCVDNSGQWLMGQYGITGGTTPSANFNAYGTSSSAYSYSSTGYAAREYFNTSTGTWTVAIAPSGSANTAATFTPILQVEANGTIIGAVGGGLGSAGTPVFSPVGGTYSGTQSVTITCALGTAYYQIGAGAVTIYSSAISVTASETINAGCYGTALNTTPTSAAYVINASYQDQASFSGTSGTLITAYTTTAGKTFALYSAGSGTVVPQLTGSSSVDIPSGSYATLGDSLDTLTPSSANYTVGLTCTASVSTAAFGVFARAQSGSNTNYAFIYSSTSALQLYAQYSGTYTELANISYTWTGTHTMTLEVNGSTITAQVDNSNISGSPFTDTNVTAAGQAGFRVGGGSTGTCTNFYVQ
jgi:hypothetical protein